uniref:28S ribosomal protein S36, mitochondrial n=1 Tax=Arion vulgaris TaxID=1028688 RepID=A0A0B7AWA5_9EUPU
MALAAARAAVVKKQVIKPHIPLIKFPLRNSAPTLKEHVGTAVGKPDTLDQVLSTVITDQNPSDKGSTGPSVGASQIPQKYRRKVLTKEEMEIIEKGGPL